MDRSEEEIKRVIKGVSQEKKGKEKRKRDRRKKTRRNMKKKQRQ